MAGGGGPSGIEVGGSDFLQVELPFKQSGKIVIATRSATTASTIALATVRRLIAFGIGPFDVIDGGKSKSGVPVRTAERSESAISATW